MTGRIYALSRKALGFFDAASGLLSMWPSTGLPQESKIYTTALVKQAGSNSMYVSDFTDWNTDSSIRRINVQTGQVEATYPVVGQLSASNSIAVTPNGRVLYAATEYQYFPMSYDVRLGIIGSSTLVLPDATPVISGEIYRDLNLNGSRDAGENWFTPPGKPNPRNKTTARVYIDLNDNGMYDWATPVGNTTGMEPSVLVSQAGTYRIPMPPGTYRVRVVGHDPQYTSRGNYGFPIFGTSLSGRLVTVGAEGNQVANVDFPMTAGYLVRGMVNADQNGDGVGTDEPLVVGYKVYVDLNNDGVRQSNEPFTETSSTIVREPPGSNYLLAGPPGKGVIRIENSLGQTVAGQSSVVSAGPEAIYIAHFAPRASMTLSGTLFDDANSNGRRDVGEAPRANVRVWLDVNENRKFNRGEPTSVSDANGHYRIELVDLWPWPRSIRFRDADASPLTAAPTTPTVTFTDWQQAHVQDFSFYVPAGITLRAFVDANRNRKFNKGDRAAPGVIAYIDRNDNGKQDKSEQFAVTDSHGNVTFDGLKPGEYVVRVRFGSNVTPTTATVFNVKLKDGEYASLSAGMRPIVLSSIAVNTFLDLNGNRKFNKGDRAAPGVIAYIDRNNNGKQDKNEHSAITDLWGNVTFDGLTPGEYVIRVRVGSSMAPTTATVFTVSLSEDQNVRLRAGMR